MKICTVEGCEGKHYGQGLCNKHWQRWRYHGRPGAGPHLLVNEMPCAVDDCGRFARSRGLCEKHYRRGQVRGTFDPVELAGARKQRATRIYERIDRDGYRLVLQDGEWQREHRLV